MTGTDSPDASCLRVEDLFAGEAGSESSLGAEKLGVPYKERHTHMLLLVFFWPGWILIFQHHAMACFWTDDKMNRMRQLLRRPRGGHLLPSFVIFWSRMSFGLEPLQGIVCHKEL